MRCSARERHDAAAVLHREAVGEQRDRLRLVGRHLRERRLQLVGGARADVANVEADAAGGRLGIGALAALARIRRIGEQRDAADRRRHLAQQLEALAVQLDGHVGEAGHVRIRPGQAFGEAGDDRIGAVGVDHRHRQAQRLDLEHRLALDDDQVDRQAHQLVGEPGDLARVVVGVAEVDRQVAAFDEAEVGERAAERLDERNEAGRPLRRQPADARAARRRLRAGAARQEAARRGGKEEFTSSHGEHRVRSGSVARRQRHRIDDEGDIHEFEARRRQD